MQRLGKHGPIATYTQATTDEPLEVVFSKQNCTRYYCSSRVNGIKELFIRMSDVCESEGEGKGLCQTICTRIQFKVNFQLLNPE
jgi:hypothetical protein